MNYIKQSLKKVFIPVLIFAFVSMLLTLVLTGIKRGLVNLEVRGFWGFKYPDPMPNPENYTYIDELIDIIDMILNLVLIVGVRRYCIKKLNEEACSRKDIFCFWVKPKLFFSALLCEYVPTLVISFVKVGAGAVTMLNTFFLAVIGVFGLAVSIGFTVLSVFLWLTPSIYSVNIEKGIRYAFGNSFSVAKKYFWKFLIVIVVVEIIKMLVSVIPFVSILFISVLIEMLTGIIFGYYILEKEQLIENTNHPVNQE